MAKALATNGAKKVYILGRRKELLESAADGESVIVPVQCDVTSKESLQSAVDTITRDVGYINLLIANAGIPGPKTHWDPAQSVQELRKALFENTSMEDFTQAFHVNVTGAFFTILAFTELLDAGNKNALKGGFGAPLQQGSDVPSIQSQVIVTASISGFIRLALTSPAYSGSKAAIMHLTKQASSMMARYGIRANALAPGREFRFPNLPHVSNGPV
jgi:NAD(P)-dependent dehydrogenase (short-subunit alcohol dehydrogenase family)